MRKFFKILPLLLITCVHADSLETIAQKRLQNFVQEAPSTLNIDDATKSFVERMRGLFTIKTIESTLPDYQRCLWTHFLFNQTEHQLTTVLNGNASDDLDVISNKENKKTLLDNINRLHTSFGDAYLSYLLTNPVSDITTLHSRQTILKTLQRKSQTTERLESLLAIIAQSEKELLLLWEEEQNIESTKQLTSPLYYTNNWPIFHHIKKLNSSPLYQEIAVATDHTFLYGYLAHTETFLFLMGYIHAGQKLINVPMSAILKAAAQAYSQSRSSGVPFEKIASKLVPIAEKTPVDISFAKTCKNLIEASAITVYSNKRLIYTVGLPLAGLTLLKATQVLPGYTKKCSLQNYFQAKLIHIAAMIKAMKEINVIIANEKDLSQNLVLYKKLSAFFNKNSTVSPKMRTLIGLLETNTFTGKATIFSRQGRVKAAYSLIKNIKNELAPALCAIGEIDVYVSTSRLLSENASGSKKYVFAHYKKNAEAPSIQLTNMWNPFVNKEVAVVNSITLGGNLPQNAIITGPNAGGKSTFLKGLTLSIILAQTLGIAPCDELIFTPFEKISTYMNIVDDVSGGNSLFKAEVLRAQELINTIETQEKTNGFCFSVLDEIFSGTSPKEGAAASWSVANHLGTYKNSITLIASHFVAEMTTLETSTTVFKNYCVKVNYNEDGSFAYLFKLEPGITDQNVAIDILQQSGFNLAILRGARDKLAE